MNFRSTKRNGISEKVCFLEGIAASFPLVNALDGDALYFRIDLRGLDMVKIEAKLLLTTTAVWICPAARKMI